MSCVHYFFVKREKIFGRANICKKISHTFHRSTAIFAGFISMIFTVVKRNVSN